MFSGRKILVKRTEASHSQRGVSTEETLLKLSLCVQHLLSSREPGGAREMESSYPFDTHSPD